MNPEQIQALAIILEFVERWNKTDKEFEVAEAAGKLERFIERYEQN